MQEQRFTSNVRELEYTAKEVAGGDNMVEKQYLPVDVRSIRITAGEDKQSATILRASDSNRMSVEEMLHFEGQFAIPMAVNYAEYLLLPRWEGAQSIPIRRGKDAAGTICWLATRSWMKSGFYVCFSGKDALNAALLFISGGLKFPHVPKKNARKNGRKNDGQEDSIL